MKTIYEVIVSPIITEKATAAKEHFNEVSFVVDKRANKKEIKDAIEKIFKVKVMDVKTVNMPGKVKRVRLFQGLRSGYKKALVRLKQGNKIEFFQGV